MGSAEVGRELGDAGGPLLVGALAAVATLTVGLLGLVGVLVAVAVAVALTRREAPTPPATPEPGHE